MSNKPNTIFKYEGFTTQSLLNLKAQSVYFGSPRNFNDPYDCAITASITDPTTIELEHLREFYISDPNFSAKGKKQLEELSEDELKIQLLRGANVALDKAKEIFLNNNGITCFSERNDDLLMWSHYGGQYKGFCLEFLTEYEPFNNLRKVQYVKKMPIIRMDSFVYDKNLEKLLDDIYCTKSLSWAYEKEWRGLHKQAGTLYTYKPKALKAIYFGPDIEQQALEIICLILAGQNPEVELWKGIRSEFEFKVNFTNFTYTSYIEAKRKGLI